MRRSRKGFTLMEVLIVAIILAILAGIVVPQYARTLGHAREAEGWTFLGAIRASELRYYAEYNETFTGTIGKLDIENPAAASVPPMFSYCVKLAGSAPFTTFTAIGVPRTSGLPPLCGGCRTLCVDEYGRKQEVVSGTCFGTNC